MDKSSKYSDNSMSRHSGRFFARRNMIQNRSSGQHDNGPRRISDLRKMEFGTDLHSRLSFIKWASKWLYRAGLEKRNKNSLIMDFKDMKMQTGAEEDVETEILKKIGQRRASEIASANPKQFRNINDEVRRMSREMIEIKGMCDSADAEGVVEKFNEVEEENQARMELLVEQENKIEQLQQDIGKIQDGVRKMSSTGNICDRPSCDDSLGSSGQPHDHSSQGEFDGGKKNMQAALDKRRSTLDTHKNNLTNIYEKVKCCLEAAGDVSGCLDDRLGPDKEVTEKTVFECLARLNERVDQLLTVKAYFDYREELGNQREHDQHQDELPPIKNPFVGNIEQSPGPKKTSGGVNETNGEAAPKSLINDKDLPYCQLQGEKKTCDTGMDDDRSSVLAEEPRIRSSVSEKLKKKSASDQGNDASTSDSAAFRYYQSLAGAQRRRSSTLSQPRPPPLNKRRPPRR